MAAGTNAAHPIETLSRQSLRLADVLTVCLAKPTPAAVHHLRTTIRRVEAQTTVLAQLRGLPPHGRESTKLRKHLKKLRRVAGRVRDLDVQLNLVAARSTPETAVESKRLRRRLRHQRDDEAEVLIDLIRRLHRKVSRAIEQLLAALRSVEQLEVSVNELAAIAQRWFGQRCRPTASRDQLHTTRKAAKLARYMLDAAPNSITAKRAAKNYEDIQHKGGQWHDWLQLAATASDILEKRHPLIELYKRERDAKFGSYRKTLSARDRQAKLRKSVT
jgi:CHAD domain-containing protein